MKYRWEVHHNISSMLIKVCDDYFFVDRQMQTGIYYIQYLDKIRLAIHNSIFLGFSALTFLLEIDFFAGNGYYGYRKIARVGLSFSSSL